MPVCVTLAQVPSSNWTKERDVHGEHYENKEREEHIWFEAPVSIIQRIEGEGERTVPAKWAVGCGVPADNMARIF